MRISAGRERFAAVLVMVCALATNGWARAEQASRMLRWTTNEGHTFEARFVRLQSTAVIFLRGRFEFTVPIFELSPTSIDLARHEAMRRPRSAEAVTPLLHATQPVPIARAVPVAPASPSLTPAVLPLPPPVAAIAFGPSILAFCQENVGRKIGTGQCASLASAALRNAGAAIRGGADWPGEGDYVWGDPVAFIKAGFFGLKGVRDLAHVEAGDIIQFHDARFSGFDHAQDGLYQYEARHHTAVVESVDPAHETISVLHQNWNGREFVRRQMLYLRGMTNGWLRIYRPVPPSA